MRHKKKELTDAELIERRDLMREDKIRKNMARINEQRRAIVGGITVEDWENFGLAVITMGDRIYNADDMQSVLRSLKWDARIKSPDALTLNHLRIVMTLITLGRVDSRSENG